MSHWSRYHRWARRTGTLAMGIGAVLWTGAVVDGQRESGRASQPRRHRRRPHRLLRQPNVR